MEPGSQRNFLKTDSDTFRILGAFQTNLVTGEGFDTSSEMYLASLSVIEHPVISVPGFTYISREVHFVSDVSLIHIGDSHEIDKFDLFLVCFLLF